MKKVKMWVQTNKIGSRCEDEIELEVPENYENDVEFQNLIFDMIWDSGMVEWGFEVE